MDIILMTLVVLLSTVSGKPFLRLDACSESEAMFTCIVMESTLSWDIDFLSGDDIDRVFFTIGERSRKITLQSKRGPGVEYTFMVTSISSSFTSTMTTNAPADLSRATVSCSNSRQRSANNTTTLVLPEPPHPPSITLTATMSFRSEPNVESSLLHWNLADTQAVTPGVDVDMSYLVFLSSESNQSNFTTSNTSIVWLTLLYDQDYNISVVAKNCFGTSEPAELHVVWDDQCPIPWENISSNVTFEYSINETRLIYNHFSGLSSKREIVSVCTSNGSWYPNPAEVDLCTVPNQGDCDNSGVTTTGSNGKYNQELHVLPIAVSISIAVVFLFLVVLSLAVSLFVIHRRKRYLRSEVQTAEQAQNEYTEVERTHYYQDDDLDYSSLQLQLDHDHSRRDNHSTFGELHNPLYQNETNNNPDESRNLDSLLIQLRTHVTPKWYEFGTAIGVPEELLQQYSSYPADERLIEVLNYLLRHHQNPTWRDIAKLLHDTELHDLAESIMNVYETGHLPIEIDADDSDSDENILLPLPLPSNML